MRNLLATAAMILTLGIGVLPPALAQDAGTTGGAAGGTSGADTSRDTGGTTGTMTTTPEAKSEDAAGTSDEVATPGGAETATGGANHGCTDAQRYDAATNTCVAK